jgi:type VI secretion system protein VasD
VRQGGLFAKSTRTSFVCVLCTLTLVACASKPPPPKPPAPVAAEAVIAGSADINPDPNGSPSSVVVRIYQLRTDGAFNGSDFFALYPQEKEALGADLISRDERVLLPGQQLKLELTLSPEARFVGVLAAFHDYQTSHWRAITEIPQKPLPKKAAKRGIAVRVDKDMIAVSTTN